MIFNVNESSVINDADIKESPYALSLEGTLMHMYENECNYNALMEAVGLSELKYYRETGKDLFLNEAGAFSSFLDKVKSFFRKILEKIKAIFKKFVTTINSFVMKDKDFVKKYQRDILTASVKDFEFKGYTFSGINDVNKIDFKGSTMSFDSDSVPTDKIGNVEEQLEEKRKSLLPKSSSTKLTIDDYKKELKEQVYGSESKEDLKNISFADQIGYITKTEDDIKKVKSTHDDLEKEINQMIKELNSIDSKIDFSTGKDTDEKTNKVKNIEYAIKVNKSVMECATYAFGLATTAYKDRNRQAKAICVKVLSSSSKNESAVSLESNNIFDNVVIK